MWEFTFREKGRPTLIRQGNGQSVYSRGRVWVDAATGAVLDSRTVSDFGEGLYLAWSVRGSVKVKVTYLGGANAVTSERPKAPPISNTEPWSITSSSTRRVS